MAFAFPKVSVLLTSYNHAKYLRESIDSVLNQTFKDFELLIWDDASVDESWEIITSYTDKRIRTFRNDQNQFIEYFRKAVSETAQGEYIAIHHSDDIWEPEKLEKQVAFLNANPQVGAVFTQAHIINEDGLPFPDHSHPFYKVFDQPNRSRYGWLNYFFYQSNALCHPSVLIRKQCYEDVGLYRYGLAQLPDFDMWIRLCMKYEIYVLSEKLIRFRLRNNEANSSGARPDTHIRVAYEYTQIVENYRQIKTRDEFVQIFPDSQKYFHPEYFDADYILARIALEPDRPFYTKLFGLNLLFELLNNQEKARDIKHYFGFGHLDFLALTAKYDVFSVEQKRLLEQHVLTLSAQMAEKEQHVLALSAQMAEKEQHVLALSAQVVEKEQQALVFSNQVTEKDQQIQAFLTQAAAREQILMAQRAEAEQALQSVKEQMNGREKVNASNLSLLHERERVLQGLNAKLWEIYGSRSWRLIQMLWRIRLMLIPHGSKRERVARALKRYVSKVISRRRTTNFSELSGSVAVQAEEIKAAKEISVEMDQSRLMTVTPVRDRPNSFASPHQASVDVVVCVHNALDDTVRCLDSILAHTAQPYRIIIINDGSQGETSEYLNGFAKAHNAALIINEEALGYTRAANQGLQISTADYVLLLNSDTIVSDEWLDRMCACIESNPNIGIVGPLSNTASWQSIPEMLENGDWATNSLPDFLSVEKMAEMVAGNSSRLYPEMKLLNGFCIMLRHKLLEDVGLFDEDTFGAGYGEEDDYILRTRAKGWKLALADDVYIYHAQSKSYSHERRKVLTSNAGKALVGKHGQEIIDASCSYSLNSPVLEGVRSRNKVMIERENLISLGKKKFGGKRILFALPVALAGGGANVVFSEAAQMIKMGVDVRIFNLMHNRYSFHDSYPDLTIPVTFGSEADFVSLARLYDAAIATVYFSVEWLKPMRNLKDRPALGYYVQGFEPLIYPPNTAGYNQALASYTSIPEIIPFTKTLWTREQVLLNTGVACTPIGVSIDIDLFRPRPRDENADRSIVVSAMIRPETPYREPVLTMQVLKKIIQIYGSRVEIRIFGTRHDNPDFGKLPLDFPWKLAGMLNPSQVASFFNETDIFVDLSSHQAMGLTALEAMACGNAVVVPDNGGTGDYGNSGENCLIVDTSSFENCVDAIRKLIDDRNLLARIQKNAIHDVCAFYPERPAYNILNTLFPNL